MAYKGKFRPNNPEKYKGDPTGIIYRSLWELKVFRQLDMHPDVIEWSSEEIIVPYMNPTKKNKDGSYGRMSRYFPDIVVRKRLPNGTTQTMMIEIKPKGQTKLPDISKKNKTPSGRVSRRYLNEVKTYAVNEAKWKAAEEFCKDRGWAWLIMTEDHIQPGKK